MRQIDSFFSNKVDLNLYHYTDISALIGIAKDKKLWASNVYYLNDSEEITYACDILNEILLPRMAFQTYRYPENEFIKQLQKLINICRTHKHNLFAFSLSQKASILSQWRSYTPHGKGVSIGINPDTLNELVHKNNLKLARCIYDRVAQEEAINGLLDKLLITFRQEQHTFDISRLDPWQSYHPYLDKFLEVILQVLSIIKHQAFEEEHEWRLMSPYYPEDAIQDIKYREGASMLVPYIELGFGVLMPIFEIVILGPSQHHDLSLSALSTFLSKQNICKNSDYCNIPYREW